MVGRPYLRRDPRLTSRARGHLRDLLLQPCDARTNHATVHFDLCLARASRSDAAVLPGRLTTRLTGQGTAPAAQTRKHVFELSQLHLGLALTRCGMLGENVEDHGGTVHHLHLGGVFQASTLAWRQVVVDHDGVGLLARHDVGDLLRLAGPDICGGVGP